MHFETFNNEYFTQLNTNIKEDRYFEFIILLNSLSTIIEKKNTKRTTFNYAYLDNLKNKTHVLPNYFDQLGLTHTNTRLHFHKVGVKELEIRTGT